MTGQTREALAEAAREAARAVCSWDTGRGYSTRQRKLLDAIDALATAAQAQSEPQWIGVDERLPEPMTMVLAAFEMDRPGDWRMKAASYEPLCHEFSIVNQGGWRIFGGGWKPTHWREMPAPPTTKDTKHD